MSQRLTSITFVNADSIGCRIVPALQKIFILACACTERDEESTSVDNAARRLANKVIPLLRNQPRNDRDDGAIRFFRKTKAPQQIELAFALARHVAGGEILRD